MEKRFIAIALLVLLMLSAFAGCGEKEKPEAAKQITTQEAVQIAVADAGYAMTDVTGAHPHTGEKDGKTIYEVHFDCDGKTFTYVIDAATGEILSRG